MEEHSKEYPRIKKLYNEGRLTEVGLDNAVRLGLITPEEKIEIMQSN